MFSLVVALAFSSSVILGEPIMQVPDTSKVAASVDTLDAHAAMGYYHLRFKDIEIDGPVEDFNTKIESLENFRKIAPSKFVGLFAGYSGCRIDVFDIKGTVWKVKVSFPSSELWPVVKEQYHKLKDWFCYKYVVSPVVVKENLHKKYAEGSGKEIWGFENHLSTYMCSFDFTEGTTVLYVEFDKASGGVMVCIDYVDRINSIMKEENDMMDL